MTREQADRDKARLARFGLQASPSGKWYTCHCQAQCAALGGQDFNHRALDRHRATDMEKFGRCLDIPRPIQGKPRPRVKKGKGKGRKVGVVGEGRSSGRGAEGADGEEEGEVESSDLEVVDITGVSRAKRTQSEDSSLASASQPARDQPDALSAKRQRLAPPQSSPQPQLATVQTPSRTPELILSTTRHAADLPPESTLSSTTHASTPLRDSQTPTPDAALIATLTAPLNLRRQRVLDDCKAKLHADQLAEDQARVAEHARQAAAQAHAGRRLEDVRALVAEAMGREDKVAALAGVCARVSAWATEIGGLGTGSKREDGGGRAKVGVKEEAGVRGRASAGLSPVERKLTAAEEEGAMNGGEE